MGNHPVAAGPVVGSDATIRQCAVLVGGLGSRLGAITADTPKPILDVGGRPFLYWLLRELSRFGVEDVLLLSGHLSERLAASVGDIAALLPRKLSVAISEEPIRAGTGGALFHARERLDARFLMCNGDSLLDANLGRLLAAAYRDPPDVMGRMLLRALPDTSRYGVVETYGDHVTAFHERGEASGPGVINAGVYAFDRRVLGEVGEACSLEREVLPRLAARGALRGTQADGWFIDIGVPDDLARARAELSSRLRRRALFLVLDAVIDVNRSSSDICGCFEWIDGAGAAIRNAGDSGWHVFIVADQSGVTREYKDESVVAALHERLGEEARRDGGTVDDVRYRLVHPEAPLGCYRRVGNRGGRTPGMIQDLLRAWELDPADCMLVGGKLSDIAAAAAAGVAGFAFEGGDLGAFLTPLLKPK